MIDFSLNTKYIQKSILFLWPLLKIPSRSVKRPIQVYSLWKPHYDIDSCKFIMLYSPEDVPQVTLESHHLLEDIIETQDGNFAYVFDLSQYSDLYDLYVKGKYSKFSKKHKSLILECYERNKRNYEIIKSYLYPEDYIKDYADFYMVEPSILEDIGELCSPPDLEQENCEETI